MSISLHKELTAKLAENRQATEKELLQNLQNCLDDIVACGLVLTCDISNNIRLDNATQDFTILSEAEYAAEGD